MDKKNIFLGTLFLAAAAVCFYINARYYPARPNPTAVHEAAAPAPTASAPGAPAMPPATSEPLSFAAAAVDHAGAHIVRLSNSYIEADFSDFGGALRDVALQKYPAALNSPQPFVMNELHKDLIAAFVALPGLDSGTRYEIVSQTNRDVVFRTVWNKEVEVTRHFILSPDQVAKTDPYEIRLETTFKNLTNHVVTMPPLQVALGTAAPVSPQDRGLQLTTAFSQNGKQTFTARGQLEPSGGFLGLVGGHPAIPQIEHPGPMQWLSVANQFFVSILTPDQPAAGMVVRRVKLLPRLPDTDNSAYGVTADAVIDVPTIAAGGTSKISGMLYTGPKEYHRLANADVFQADQDRVMNFGMFRFFSALLLTLMTWMHSLVSNWGVAIILTTVLLKIIFIPFTVAAARSAKRMQKLQPELQKIKEKYKDNPQKQQLATMELFKEHKVNPVGGCLPMLITLPFFWGFFRMLYSAAELRFAHFLWAKDLSAPDTVAVVFGFPINVLPLLLGITMFLQMQFTPQPTAAVDNSQARMMKFMPFLFMFFCYSYSCALSLYSTVNALFSIGQQMVINRMKDPIPAPAGPSVSSRGKALKNVTPRRK